MNIGALLAVCLIGGIIAGAIAQARTGRFWGFFIFGFLLPLIGIIVACLQPKRVPTPAYAPGWYPDPHGQAGQRWFDGQVWTQHVSS